jgi:hypothetical protein
LQRNPEKIFVDLFFPSMARFLSNSGRKKVDTSSIKDRCYAFEKDALKAFRRDGGYDKLIQKTKAVGSAIGSGTGGLLAAGGSLAGAIFVLGTGPIGLGLAFGVGLFIGGGGGYFTGRKLALKWLKGTKEFKTWKEKELKEETIKGVAELFQKHFDEDPFLKGFRCPLSEKVILVPTLIVGHQGRYDLTSLLESCDENGQILFEGKDPIPFDLCKPDRLLAVLIQHRQLALLNKEIEKGDQEEGVKELLSQYYSELKQRHEEAVVELQEELAATHTIQHEAFTDKESAEPCRRLSRLLFQCRTLEYERLIERDTAKSCQKRRKELLALYEELQKKLDGLDLDKETHWHVNEISGDIAMLLEIDTTMHRVRSEQQLGETWLEKIAAKQIEEAEQLMMLCSDPNAQVLGQLLTQCRFYQLDHWLGTIEMAALKELHQKLKATLPGPLKYKDESGLLNRLEASILTYFSFSAKYNLEGADWKKLDPFDDELLNHFGKTLQKIPARQLIGDVGMALKHLQDGLAKSKVADDGIVEQFRADYITWPRQTADIFLYDGETLITSLVVRGGIKSGDCVLGALEDFAGEDLDLCHVLQAYLCQYGQTAFLQGALSTVDSPRLEELTRTVRRRNEKQVELSMASRVIIPDVEEMQRLGQRVVLAHMKVGITFFLQKREKGWEVDEAKVTEREVPHYVTKIPELPLYEEMLEKISLAQLCKEKRVFVERKSNFIGSSKIGDLYFTFEKVDSVRSELKKVEGIDEALNEAALSSTKWLKHMIDEATGRKILSIELQDEKRVISRDQRSLLVTKVAGGVVKFDGGETLYFPYREKVSIANGKRTLDPLFLTDAPFSYTV